MLGVYAVSARAIGFYQSFDTIGRRLWNDGPADALMDLLFSLKVSVSTIWRETGLSSRHGN